ncbi:MAG: alpha amylase C-terminal domain-containing protein [Salinivirgaceae bacterium]|nr:alpha amylase C-terminal domain-containing protein [Salinivirgaceae bacterium]
MNVPKIVQNDPWLSPFSSIITKRMSNYCETYDRLLKNQSSLLDFANGHLFYGCFCNGDTTTLRERLPNATEVYLIGDFNNWQATPEYKLKNIGGGNWEITLPASVFGHLSLYRLKVCWKGGNGERIPAWARRVVQNEKTAIFSAQVWAPLQPHQWQVTDQLPNAEPFIYEAHIGMAGEKMGVSTFAEFRQNVLPRIQKLGYNVVQLMAIHEHPYYGSFGYHVSSFFAPSSRFGTPEELKALVDDCHSRGIRVVMDLVHSHAVKNINEGLGLYDGTRYQFFHEGERGEHPAWDSFCFNYANDNVLHFLLSNIKYWLTEFHFDGFRFDGVTSMIYYNHGLGNNYTSYEQYFDGTQDDDAITYLKLANKLIKEVNPNAISIAEEMSGYPGLAAPIADGGLGFDFRLAMGVPDMWIKILKEQTDDSWDLGHIYHELTSKRDDERVISYAESHDQALVGDKTIAFWLMDKEMYFNMMVDSQNLQIDRGMALHKMIRLLTASTAGGGYLNFMGNEFGHPEWIDFPREGNNWSYQYARRQWSLVDRKDLKYQYLNEFDLAMVHLLRQYNVLGIFPFYAQQVNQQNKVMAFTRGDLLFVFNFNSTESFTNYGVPVIPGKYKILMDTDEQRFGGFGRIDHNMLYMTAAGGESKTANLNLYLPSRTAIILQRQAIPSVYQRLTKKK